MNIAIMTDGRRFYLTRKATREYKVGLFGRTRQEPVTLVMCYGNNWRGIKDTYLPAMVQDFLTYGAAVAYVREQWGKSATIERPWVPALPPAEKETPA